MSAYLLFLFPPPPSNFPTSLIFLLGFCCLIGTTNPHAGSHEVKQAQQRSPVQPTAAVTSPRPTELRRWWAGTCDVFCSFQHPALELCNSELVLQSERFSEHSFGERKNMSFLGGFHHDTCTRAAIYLNSSHVSHPRFITALKTLLYFTMLKNKFFPQLGKYIFLGHGEEHDAP